MNIILRDPRQEKKCMDVVFVVIVSLIEEGFDSFTAQSMADRHYI